MKLIIEDISDTLLKNAFASVKQYLIDNKDLVIEHKFKELYEKIPTYTVWTRGRLTDVLLNSGINPLYFMEKIPRGFGTGSIEPTIKIPNSIVEIGSFAFSGNRMLTNIDIPGSVVSINQDAFNGCFGLKYVTLEEGIVDIGMRAFYSCVSLENIVIPESVERIGEDAFRECTSLKSITISNNVKSIGGRAFYRCQALEKVNYIGTQEEWKSISKYLPKKFNDIVSFLK